MNDCIAYLECRLVQTVDVGTHFMFIGELLNAEIINGTKDPMTYQYFRTARKGVAPKNAPTYVDKSKLTTGAPAAAYGKYRCTACGYIHDEAVAGKKFADLPAGWVCPSCGSEKEDFMEIIT
jgi:rubredoxin